MNNIIASLNHEEHARLNSSFCNIFHALYGYDYKNYTTTNCPIKINKERNGILFNKTVFVPRVVVDENGDYILILEEPDKN